MNNGKCVCGEISYEIDEKIETLYQCHCSICQIQTGSSCQTGAFVSALNFKWCSGEDKIITYSKQTGYSYSFCSCCGATVPNMFRSGDKYWVPAGAMLGLKGAQIKNHIFVSDRAEWDHIAGNGMQHPGFYPVYA
ncbi:GFA family protein [Marinicellulosiphila megalodicopiae]|uniref:GFA family protein n=1 Tax=Marinicellulosiphila megalodicopiae TaxID=2724896 RepID=UPI003BB0C6E4